MPEILQDAKVYLDDARIELEGPNWQHGCFWVYATYDESILGVLLYNAEGKRLPEGNTRDSILKKLEFLLDNL